MKFKKLMNQILKFAQILKFIKEMQIDFKKKNKIKKILIKVKNRNFGSRSPF